MASLLKRFVDLREGEGTPVLQAFLALFFFVAGHTILETARDALFLTKLPADRLTLVYALLAVLALLSTGPNTRFALRFGRRNALIFTLMIAAYGTTVIYFEPKTPAMVFVLYVWSAFLGTIINVQFWMFAGQLFTIAQGKRLFAPITSGGVLGAAVGASFAAFALRAVPVESLLLASVVSFFGAAVLLTAVKTDEARPAIAALKEARITPAAALQGGIIRFFKEQPYLRRIAIMTALSTAAIVATDYMFKSAAARFGSGKALGEFFALYYAVLNGAALVVQAAVASRILRRQGVLFAVLVLPVLLFSGSVGVALAGGLFALVLVAKGADGALRHSLHRVSTELLWLPVPAEARDRGKAMIDGVLTRAMQALTAGLILGMSVLGYSSPRELALMVVILAGGWIAASIALRSPYLDLFRQAFRRGSIESGNTPDELDVNSVEAVLEFLSSRDPLRVIAAMDLLIDNGRARLIPGLILYHESEEVLARALDIFASDRGRGVMESWFPLSARLLTDPRPAVRIAAIRACGKKAMFDEIEKCLEDEVPAVSANAAFYLVQTQAQATAPLSDPRITRLLTLEGEHGRSARIALLDSIRDFGDERWADFILAMSASADGEIVEHAARAMAKIRDTRFIPRLIDRLDLREGRAAIRDALCAFGEPALDALEERLRDERESFRVRLHIPRTIARFQTQRAADILVGCLVSEHPGAIRYKALRGLGHMSRLDSSVSELSIDRKKIEGELIKNLVEHLRMTSLAHPLQRALEQIDAKARSSGNLVVGLLRNKSEQALERAFRLLQIAHPREDLRSIYLALGSTDRRVRANALEFLDVLATPRGRPTPASEDKRALLRIVADDLDTADRCARAARFLPQLPASYAEALSLLVRDSDEFVAAIAAYHALESSENTVRQDALAAYEARPSLGRSGWLASAFGSAPAEALGG